ncbi:MAG: hypothetical protein GY778_07385, partial [bacterium]|nr:hypothetical protein [bacterium]
MHCRVRGQLLGIQKEVFHMPRITLGLVIACLAVAGPPVTAEMCALDVVPAATLLLPYFEVDLEAEPGAGVNTAFTIHNALPVLTIAHVSLWTDWSQPVLNWDIFLTGYDAQTVDLYDVFVNGNLPVTADAQSDQGQDGGRAGDPTSSCDGTVDSCSPHGRPDWDGSFDRPPPLFDCIDFFRGKSLVGETSLSLRLLYSLILIFILILASGFIIL